MTRCLSLLQIPEVCEWNPYVAAAAGALTARGVEVVTPGLCLDLRTPYVARQPERTTCSVNPDIVHLHWPEKLARQVGADVAAQTLAGLAHRGAVIVQTIHNIAAHENAADLEWFQRLVDRLSDGIHVFSPEHEQLARHIRPGLPDAVLRMPHPQFPTVARRVASPAANSVGCVGRLRGYKRTAGFTRAFLEAAGSDARLVVAGEPDTDRIDRELRALAADDVRFEYQPGFVDDRTFWSILASVEWVALPYARLYSSGVLVAALQMGRRVLSPTPVGGLSLYRRQPASDRWVVVDPWDDDQAVAAWLSGRNAPVMSPPTLSLPSWNTAAARLHAFYLHLVTKSTRRRTAAPDHYQGEDSHG